MQHTAQIDLFKEIREYAENYSSKFAYDSVATCIKLVARIDTFMETVLDEAVTQIANLLKHNMQNVHNMVDVLALSILMTEELKAMHASKTKIINRLNPADLNMRLIHLNILSQIKIQKTIPPRGIYILRILQHGTEQQFYTPDEFKKLNPDDADSEIIESLQSFDYKSSILVYNYFSDKKATAYILSHIA